LLLVLPSACATPPASSESEPAPHYAIAIDSSRPAAEVRLTLARTPEALVPARDGDGSGISDVRCADGPVLARDGTRWLAPAGCRDFRWRVALDPLDGRGLDASVPAAAFSRRHSYWILPERDSLLRASDLGGTAALSLRLPDGSLVERRYLFPSNQQPPFYAVIGAAPTTSYARDGLELRVFGAPPDFAWMDSIHRGVIEAWARWRRDLVVGHSPARIDWAWVEPTADLEPGYAASAGAEAIISQIRLREGDPDAEAKARAVIATSAAHEGFHSLTGAAGQAWPGWVNESLASHFAIEAVRRFLPPADFRFVERFFIEPELSGPLLVAQSAFAAGDGDQAQLFYLHGARFWREIEAVLEVPPNGSGRLAALILGSRNFAGVDLQNADSVAAFLDRHSAGRAGPIVRCYLEGRGCPAGPLASR
jgi:hypothetical protein